MPGRILSSTGVSQGGIVEFNTDGSNIVNLTANTFDAGCTNEARHKSTHPSTTRDGRLIAFSSDRDVTGAVGADGSANRIFVMNADGTGVRQLTTSAGATIPGGTTAGDFNPVISPDGTRVAFISKRNTPASNHVNNIFVVNTDGSGGIQQVTFTQSDTGDTFPRGNIISAVWSPDGTRLAFKGTRLAADNQPDSPNITSCGANAQCVEAKRIDTSAATTSGSRSSTSPTATSIAPRWCRPSSRRSNTAAGSGSPKRRAPPPAEPAPSRLSRRGHFRARRKVWPGNGGNKRLVEERTGLI